MSGYDARDMADALACARSIAKRLQTPQHIIDRAGQLDVVSTVCASNHGRGDRGRCWRCSRDQPRHSFRDPRRRDHQGRRLSCRRPAYRG